MSVETEDVLDSQILLHSGEDEMITCADVPEVRKKPSKASFYQKYSPSLKSLIPCRPFAHSKTTHPNDAAGLMSTITFSWLTSLIWKTYKKAPTLDEIWKMSEYDETERNYKRLAKMWEEELKLKGLQGASLWKVILKFVQTRLIISTIIIFIYSMAIFFGSSVIVHNLLSYISESNSSMQFGICLIVALVCVEVIRSFSGALHLAINYRSAVRCRAAVLLLVFTKALKMSPSNGSTSVGELVTMCSNDGDRIFEANHMGNMIFLGPMIFFSGLIYTCYLMGPIGLVGPILFIAIIPLQAVLIKIVNKIRKNVVKSTQSRTMKINEILSSIKLIKMYSWEESFFEVVNELRDNELKKIRQYSFMYSLITSSAYIAPLVASVVMISLYVVLGNNLTPEIAFTSIAIFNAMSYALKFSPIAISYLADANVAVKRLRKFLILDSLSEYVLPNTTEQQNVVEIKSASFAWNLSLRVPKDIDANTEQKSQQETESLIEPTVSDVKERGPALKDINFCIHQGSLVGIYGSVGSGKSSLISGIMGQLQLLDGTVAVSGSIAYVAQQAWLMNATIRENIVFGLDFDQKKYDDVILACELTKDLEIFSSGDLTEVGERGINLSGGQKQRISLARALYSDRDIYLLDDPLSAVDAHVGKSIFLEVILVRLKNKGKTIVLVTHQLQYLPHCDFVGKVENGTIIITDPPDGAINAVENETIANGSDKLEDQSLETLEVKISEKVEDEKDKEMKGKLMSVEEKGKVVGFSTYYAYTKAAGGALAGILMILFFILNVGIQQFSYFWLSYWLKQGSGMSYNFTERFENLTAPTNTTTIDETTPFPQDIAKDILLNPDLNLYLIIYASSIVVMIAVSVLRGYAYVSMTIRASHALHKALLNQVLHGTMAFFDTTPTGRILNRFQKDMDEIDASIPGVLEYFMFHIVSVFYSVGFIIYVFPTFSLVLLVTVPIFVVIYILFKPASREMKRLDILTRSPWFSHMSATISGLDTIRAYEKSNDFIEKFCFLLDQNGEAFYLFKCVNRWLSFRLEMLVMCIVTVTSILVVFDKNLVSPSFAALAFSSARLLSAMLQMTVRLLTELEARFVCNDRIKYYIEHADQENLEFSIAPDKKWPEKGEIKFQNVSLRYRDGLPLVTENLSFVFKPCEKVGVVGRTGAGKSSLAVALFRLVELAGGKILIDGLDISKLSLHDLRSRLSIIPQDPVLFSGSVRYNLDPFEQYSENEVWSALEQAHMKDTVANLPDKLDDLVAENGNNFSVGERQLICLARALLRKSKILILDEATASVDHETEKLVHEVIDDVFSKSTLVTIAHRLSSVTSCDRVLVLDEGHLVEFDSPSKLLENKDSAFFQMLSSFESGISNY